MERQSFKQFVLEEGDFLDAVKVGFKVGIKAFNKKREQQIRRQESKNLTNRLMDAEGKELEGLIKQIVDNGFSIQKEIKLQKTSDWLLEQRSDNVPTSRRHLSKKN